MTRHYSTDFTGWVFLQWVDPSCKGTPSSVYGVGLTQISPLGVGCLQMLSVCAVEYCAPLWTADSVYTVWVVWSSSSELVGEAARAHTNPPTHRRGWHAPAAGGTPHKNERWRNALAVERIGKWSVCLQFHFSFFVFVCVDVKTVQDCVKIFASFSSHLSICTQIVAIKLAAADMVCVYGRYRVPYALQYTVFHPP